MSILAQNNPLRFYANKLSRQWENTENKKGFIVTYPMYLDGSTLMCKVPKFSLIINSTGTGAVTNMVTTIYDCDGVEVFTSSSYSSSNKGTYTQVTFTGDNFQNDDVGYYEIKVVITSTDNGVETFYSDFFEWNDELDNMLKITTDSSKIILGRNPKYEYEMLYTPHEFYLGVLPLTSNTYLKEDAKEKMAVTDINYGSSALLRAFNIKANEPIFMFLRMLRILSCNGLVTLTYRFIEHKAIDIIAEIESDHGNSDLINVKIEFKVDSEIVSVYNG